ncbi:hypothetical protein HBI65_107830 [Parastagonospora nodorum]|nr:hypothetical protein HBI65_107830 [Parastagonospora nodorum]
MERPDKRERRISFNPEAVAFSPTTASARAAGVFSVPSKHDEMVQMGLEGSAILDEDATLESAQGMPSISGKEGNSSFVTLSIESLLAQGIPMEALMGALEEQHHASAQGFMNPSNITQGYFQDVAGPKNTWMPNYTFPLLPTEPDRNLVDIDELSAGLGLPSAKKEPRTEENPARTHKTRPPQGDPNALYGKLIDRALNKPLTASALAHYMKNQSESSEETVKASQDHHNPFVVYRTPKHEQPPALKVVLAPPGFGMQKPRMVTVEDEHIPTGPTIMQQNIAQVAPPGYFHQYPSQDQTGPSNPRHIRHASNRKRPRGYTRTKRTDQGPEPSAADIYPDDAHFKPNPQPFRQNYFSPPTYIPSPPVVQPEDPVSWPTPAEVYTNEPKAPVPIPAHPPQLFTPREIIASPTLHDRSAADNDVHSLLHDLPESSIKTLITLNSFDLVGDDRSLSPDQRSGTRYGLVGGGIALGDSWAPPRKEEWGSSARYMNEPFRVRPRDHAGWGGWEWAIGKGWGKE